MLLSAADRRRELRLRPAYLDGMDNVISKPSHTRKLVEIHGGVDRKSVV